MLALRTNADRFQLRALQLKATTPVEVALGHVQPSGNGSLVAPGAVAGFAALEAVVLTGTEQSVAQGSRISFRGSFASPNNALLVPIELRPVGEASNGSYLILVRLGA